MIGIRPARLTDVRRAKPRIRNRQYLERVKRASTVLRIGDSEELLEAYKRNGRIEIRTIQLTLKDED